MKRPLYILGIWDGHDAGAALLCDGRIAAAVNEERLTRRKLEVRFPHRAIGECLRLAGIAPAGVDRVACCTSDVAKTIGRVFPSSKEAYYQIRRRKSAPGFSAGLKKRCKYILTEWPGNGLTRSVSRMAIGHELKRHGLERTPVEIHDHHFCHAIAAARASGFARCLVLTVDGVGDGLSSTASIFADDCLRRLDSNSAAHSPGIFFEHVTNLLNMRELEDEGKVMALADYASPVDDDRNPMLALVETGGGRIRFKQTGHALYSALKRIHWQYPNEQFAFMAQRTLERILVQFADQLVRKTGIRHIALAGGVASNVKAGRLIRLLPEVEELYVFPHMGDGGLAMGAALASAGSGVPPGLLAGGLGLGPAFSSEEMAAELTRAGLRFRREPDIAAAAAGLIAAGRIVLWFQGRMEYGPRALGMRSILARPDEVAIRDRLNLLLKKRVWYQPFCPSLLESEARAAFADWKGRPSREMTMAYLVSPVWRPRLAGVTGVDGSCRPQIVPDESPDVFARLLHLLKQTTGCGAVLNTSFNIHGEPLVCKPEEAIDVFRRSGADALALGDCLTGREA